MEKTFRNILFGLSTVTLLLFLADSYFDIYNLEENQNIIFDHDKLQQYVRGLAVSLLVLIITIFIIEIYIRTKQEEEKKEENDAQLNKAVKLLVLSLNAYQKKLYFLLYHESRGHIKNYPHNFPFEYLVNIFDINNNLSSTLVTKTRIEDYIETYQQFKAEVWSIYLNNNLPINSHLYTILDALINDLEENENFESLLDYSKNPNLMEFTIQQIKKSDHNMEVTASNAMNPYIYLYKSINSILNFKEELMKI